LHRYIAVPLGVLKRGAIAFDPPLPEVGLYKFNAVDPSRLKAPGFNP
jgi:hypothetical protein